MIWGSTYSTMLSIIRSFHSGMQAEVRIGDATTEKIIVNNGLHETRMHTCAITTLVQWWAIGEQDARRLV